MGRVTGTSVDVGNDPTRRFPGADDQMNRATEMLQKRGKRRQPNKSRRVPRGLVENPEQAIRRCISQLGRSLLRATVASNEYVRRISY